MELGVPGWSWGWSWGSRDDPGWLTFGWVSPRAFPGCPLPVSWGLCPQAGPCLSPQCLCEVLSPQFPRRSQFLWSLRPLTGAQGGLQSLSPRVKGERVTEAHLAPSWPAQSGVTSVSPGPWPGHCGPSGQAITPYTGPAQVCSGNSWIWAKTWKPPHSTGDTQPPRTTPTASELRVRRRRRSSVGTEMGRSTGVMVRSFMGVRMKSSMWMKMSFMRMMWSSEYQHEELCEDEEELQCSPSPCWFRTLLGCSCPTPLTPSRSL